MGRPRIHHEKRITTAIRVPERLHERLTAAADERYVSVNYLVVRAIDELLRRLVPADDVELLRPEPTIDLTEFRDETWVGQPI